MEWKNLWSRKSARPWAALALLVAVGCGVLAALLLRSDGRGEKVPPAAPVEHPEPILEGVRPPHIDESPADVALPPDEYEPEDDEVDADTVPRLQQALRDYLDLPAGRISRVDAWSNLELLRQHREAIIDEVAQLVNSDDEQERLLGLFLHLELYGATAELLEMAMRDPSLYVRAEAAGWLYEQGQFDQFQAYIEDVSRALTDREREILRSLMNENPPHLNATAGLAALQLGQALPLLHRELARHDPRAREEFLGIISRADFRVDELSRQMETLAFVRPDNPIRILTESLENAEHLRLARYALVRQMAAYGLESDPEHTRLVQQSLPTPPNGHEQAPVPYREFYVEQIARSEHAILDARDEQSQQRLFTAGTIGQYREALLMTPERAPNPDAIAVIRAIEIPYMYREQRQIIADILFIDWLNSR